MDCSHASVWTLWWWRRFRWIKALDAHTVRERGANNGRMTEESIYKLDQYSCGCDSLRAIVYLYCVHGSYVSIERDSVTFDSRHSVTGTVDG